MNSSKTKRTTGMALALAIALVAAGLFLGVPAASAQVSGPSVTGDVCMQTLFGFPVTGSNRLNCTANDVAIAEATEVSPSSCREGETFNLTAKFKVNVNATDRYDPGFFFNIIGGANARLGTCSLSVLNRGVPPATPSATDDGDFCGDVKSAGDIFVTFTIPDVLCKDTNGDGFLNLPNCTSWHNNAATACNKAQDADPDTKSKCKCDDNFQVPVIVEPVPIVVEKSAAPTSVPETGGTVTYTVQIRNGATFASLTITSLNDDLYGDLGTTTNSNVSDNTCPAKVGIVLAPGTSTSCSFKALVSGNPGDTVTDVVTVCGTNRSGTASCGLDDADVTITDIVTAPTLVKTAQSAACTADVSYQVVVSNKSEIDGLTVNALTDDLFGDIATVHGNVISTTCRTPSSVIAPLGNLTCSFVGRIISDTCTFMHKNTVTGDVTDSDGKSSTPSGSATVAVTQTSP